MTTRKFKITCPRCDGDGYDVDDESGIKEGCRTCGGDGDTHSRDFKKGRGHIKVRFEILKDKCKQCAGSGRLDCTTVERGRGFFGEYRKTRRHKAQCDYCLGEGRQLLAFSKSQCSRCCGDGENDYWRKGLFGMEYKRTKKCGKCAGKGWVEEKSSHVFKGDLGISFWW